MVARDVLALAACAPIASACSGPGAASAGADLEPVRTSVPGPCDAGQHRFGGACVEDLVQERSADDGTVVAFRLHQADGRWWWFSIDRVWYRDALSLCASLDATVLLPRTQRDWGVAMHFAAVADAVYETGNTPWLGMRTNQRTAVVEADEDGRALFLFRPDLPPLPAAPNESVVERLMDAIAAVAVGEEPDPMYGCFRADYDGSVRPSLCAAGTTIRPVVCGPPPDG